jgi:REP element-mobilizing transposase RayT
VRELVRQTCEAFEIRIIKGVVSQAHVHILSHRRVVESPRIRTFSPLRKPTGFQPVVV